MNVLSLFDGCSGGQLALQRAGIHVDNYFASEIDKYAIKVTQANFPNTIQLGDVTQVKPSERGMGVDYALDYDPLLIYLWVVHLVKVSHSQDISLTLMTHVAGYSLTSYVYEMSVSLSMYC